MSRRKDDAREVVHGPVNNPNHKTAPPLFVLAHVVRSSDFLDRVAKPDHVRLLEKIQRGDTNINTTFLRPKYAESSEVEALKINTYADSSRKGNAVVLFRSSCLFLAFYETDIGSGSFRGFDESGAITPQIMMALGKWAKNKRGVYRGNMKLTPQRAIEKLLLEITLSVRSSSGFYR